MKTYIIETMTQNLYAAYMCGEQSKIEYKEIEAENAEEAIAIAKALFPELVINTGYVRTAEEKEAEHQKYIATLAEYEKEEAERRAQAKARRAEKEKLEALAKGITVLELRKRKTAERNIKVYTKHIAELRAELLATMAKLEKAEQIAKGC